MTSSRLWIYGTGGHAEVIYDVINNCQIGHIVAGFIDDDNTRAGKKINGHLIYGRNKLVSLAVEGSLQRDYVFVAIGDNVVRKAIFKEFEMFKSPAVIHTTAVIGSNVKIGEGTVVMPLSILEAGVVIGEACIINNSSLVGHGVSIGDNCHISGKTIIGGNVTVGSGTLIALGACITPGVTIGKGCKIFAGSVITKDVGDNTVMAGFPARNITRFDNTSFE